MLISSIVLVGITYESIRRSHFGLYKIYKARDSIFKLKNLCEKYPQVLVQPIGFINTKMVIVRTAIFKF